MSVARKLAGQCFEPVLGAAALNHAFWDMTGTGYNPGWEPPSEFEQMIVREIALAFIPLGRGISLVGRGVNALRGASAVSRTVRASTVATGGADDFAELAAKACSFAGDTTVLIADGTRKPIEDVEVGDKVIATDPETGEQVAKTVEHVFVHDDTVIELVVDGEVITTTEDHPFWSVTDQRFERADDLASGEQVLGADGHAITISDVELGSEREARAYNLAVEGIHTYHVGTSEVLVHNNCFTALDALNNPRSLQGLTPSQIDDLARNAGFEVLPGKASRISPAARYFMPGTNRSQGFRVLPWGVAGQAGVKGGPYLKFFGGPLDGTYVPLGAP